MDTLLRRHFDQTRAICRRLTGNDADAQDATQEAMMTIVRRIDKFDGRSAYTTWMYRVVTNACLDELRRRARRPIPNDPEELLEQRQPLVGGEDQAVVDRAVLDQALVDLPLDFRAPVVLRDVIGLDYAEIAEVLGLRPGTVRSRISRGRSQLATALGATSGNQPASSQRQNEQP